MANKEFGSRVVQLRKEKGMTQKDLAAKVYVSDKAVSRWETGKSYPDIETLILLADLFDVSVSELLKGKHEFRKNGKKRWILIIAAISVLVYIFPVYHIFYASDTNFYRAKDVSYLAFRGFISHRIKVSGIMETAENAFSEVGITEKEAEEKYGILSRYCYTQRAYGDVVKEKHKLRLWSVILDTHTSEHAGYMWVYYSRKGFDESGKINTGSRGILSLWCLEQDGNGQWRVVDIVESP